MESYSNNDSHRISWDEYFVNIANTAAQRSNCHRLQVGCVIVNNNRIVSMGYNGFLPGFPHESHVLHNHEQATVHAEQNAICDAAARGVSIRNSKAYITHYPCLTCAKLLCASGINEIIYVNDYHNDPLVRRILLIDRVGSDTDLNFSSPVQIRQFQGTHGSLSDPPST